MILQEKQIISFSLQGIKICLFILIFCIPKISSSQLHLTFKNQSDTEVLDKVSSALQIVFNYNSAVLSNNKHSFSVTGNESEIIEIVSQKLKVDIVFLEDKIYAIKEKTLLDDLSTEPILSFKIKSQTGDYLAYATIYLPELNLSFQSNNEGVCSIQGFISEQDRMLISYLGYEKLNISVKKVKEDKLVVLKTASHVLGEIVLTDFLTSVKSNELENETTIQDMPLAGLADQDLLRKAQLLPGIHSSSESLNDLQIRGGPPDQVSYKWNDIRLLQTSLFYGQVSAVNPFMVDEVAVTRNGSSANQSGQASGSILLESNKNHIDRTEVKLFSDFLYSNVGINIPIIKDKLSVKFAYRKSHNFLFETRLYQNYFDQTFQFGQLTNDQFYIDFFDIRGQERIQKSFNFDDVSANINWKPTSNLQFSASLIDLRNKFQYTYYDGLFTDDTKKDQLDIANTGWNIKGNYQISNSLKASVLYSGSRFSNQYLFIQDIDKMNGEDRFKLNTVNQNNISTNLSYEHRYFDAEVGIQHENWKVKYVDTTRIPSLGLFYDKSAVSTQEQSAFAKIKWKFIPNTLVETGVRYSDFGFSLIDRKFIEPRIHVSHYLLPQLTIHAHYGLFHQNLNRRLFYSSLDVEKGVWYLSDERPESDNFIWVVQNRQSSIGLKYIVKNWKFTLDGYTKIAQNIWTSALDFSIEEDPFAFADLRVNGLEFSSHYQNKNWKVLWTYELTDEQMVVRGDTDYKIKSPFTQPHRISLMQSYKWRNWLFSSRWRFNSGRRYSEGSRITTITDPEFQYIIEYNSILENTTPAYHSLDVSTSYKWIFNKSKNQFVEVGLHIQNVYDRQNIIKRQFFIDYTKSPFEMAFYDRKGLGFTPNISVLIHF